MGRGCITIGAADDRHTILRSWMTPAAADLFVRHSRASTFSRTVPKVIEILYVLGIVVALVFILDKLNRLRVGRLRERGIYPPRGQGSEADVERLVSMGRRIDAIKVYREIHRVGLKEAKEAVDKLAERFDLGQPKD